MSQTTAPVEWPDLALELGPDDTLVRIGPGWETAVDEPAQAAQGRRMFETGLNEVFGASARALLKAHLDSVRRGFAVEPMAFRIAHPALGARVLEAHAYRSPGDACLVTLVLRDATDHWEKLALLAESEHRFRTVAAASRDMVTETDHDSGCFTYVSAASRTVLGYAPEKLVGTPAMALHHPADLGQFVDDIRSRSPGAAFRVRRHRLRRCDGSWVWVEATGIRFPSPEGGERIIGVARDVTSQLAAEHARLELETQLQRSQRLESLGVLAGGIAHDFNNLLTPVLGSASVGADDPVDSESLLQRLGVIYASAKRAQALTLQMLAYAGHSAIARTPVDLTQTLRDLALLLASSASASVQLEYQLDDALPPILADQGQIGQIAMNLVSNAAEAARPEGGRIEIRTGSVDATRALLDSCVVGDHLEAGRYACLEVSDDGCGMNAQTRERILEPFFTTKFTGRGLGLAVVLGIIRQHGAALAIESAPEIGSRFRVLLPFARGPLRAAPAPTRTPASSAWRPSGNLLVVDDDDGVRELTSILLRRAGFRVYEAENGSRALEIFREHGREISGIVLDSTMPGMSGASVFDAIREIQPSARVLLVSGYTRDHEAEALLERGVVGFLQKPFEPPELLEAVKHLLMEAVPSP